MEKPKKNKRVLTLFLCMVPSILIGMTTIITNVMGRIGFQTILVLMQFVIIKNLIDDFYGEEYNAESG